MVSLIGARQTARARLDVSVLPLFCWEISHSLSLPMLRWIKFNVVGVFGFVLQSGALFLLTHTTHRIGYLAATAVAVELAVLNNFIWHQRWTWKDRPSSTTRETFRRLAKFNFTNGLVSIAGNAVLMVLLVGHLDMPIAGANLVSVAACSAVNFVLADRIAFDVISSPY